MSKKHPKNLYKKYKRDSPIFLVSIYALIFLETRKKRVSIMVRKQNGNKWKHKSINALKPVFHAHNL